MKISLAACFTALALVFSLPSFAQWNINWQGSGNWGPDSPYVRSYNMKTVGQFQGTVQRVDRGIPQKGMCYGVCLRMKTDRGIMTVDLGPAWFVENQDFKIGPNDQIEVIGSQIIFNRRPIILAAEINKGNTKLRLREANGFPLWCAWKSIQLNQPPAEQPPFFE
jgi:hypothetical protein